MSKGPRAQTSTAACATERVFVRLTCTVRVSAFRACTCGSVKYTLTFRVCRSVRSSLGGSGVGGVRCTACRASTDTASSAAETTLNGENSLRGTLTGCLRAR